MTTITIRDRFDHVCPRLRRGSGAVLPVIRTLAAVVCSLQPASTNMTIKLGIGGFRPVGRSSV
jgi:hypothetical protein